MRRLLTILMLCPILCMAQDDVLQQFFQNIEKKTLESDFTVTMSSKATQPTSMTGHIVMHGEQFVAEIMGMEIAYDGITLYTYNEGNDELTLSNPMPDELAEVNPLLFAKALTDLYQAETREENGIYKVTLLPDRQNTGVQEFTLQIRKYDLMPLSASMKEQGMKITTLLFRQPTFTTSAPYFKLEKPGAYINDLR